MHKNVYIRHKRYSRSPRNLTDAHYLTFWWRAAAVTAALPWSYVGPAKGYRGNPRVSTARVKAFHCTWRFHGKCHGCGHGTCRGSVRGNLRGTRHGNPRKYHDDCHGISHGHLHINCRGNPRQSTANATAFHGNCHGNPSTASAIAIRGNCHGTPRLLPRHIPRTSNHSNFHGIPRPSAANATAILQ